jgi:hypothetical protein
MSCTVVRRRSRRYLPSYVPRTERCSTQVLSQTTAMISVARIQTYPDALLTEISGLLPVDWECVPVESATEIERPAGSRGATHSGRPAYSNSSSSSL